MNLDEAGLGLCSVATFGTSGVEYPDSGIRVIIDTKLVVVALPPQIFT
jgi:hypothetical protein